MDIPEFLQITKKTEAPSSNFRRDDFRQKLMFGAGYMVTEANEVLDHIHRVTYRGEELDKEHVQEELGDVMFAMGILLRELDLDFGEILQGNVNKIEAIYGTQNGYSQNRNGIRKSIPYNGRTEHKA